MLIPPGEVERIVAARCPPCGDCNDDADFPCAGRPCDCDCHAFSSEAEALATAILTAATAAHEKVVEQNASATEGLLGLMMETWSIVEAYADGNLTIHARAIKARIDAALSSVTFGGGK